MAKGPGNKIEDSMGILETLNNGNEIPDTEFFESEESEILEDEDGDEYE